jgi:hypothetical protein
MIRFGLHLTLRSGREAVVRLAVIAMSVGIGVGLLLSALAMFHAYRSTVATPCWQCTHSESTDGPLLWNYTEDEYAGRTVERLDVATLSTGAPVMPGLTAMPAAGQYYASPAMAELLRTEPADQLADRFDGQFAGTIGRAALANPDQLVIVVGQEPAALADRPHTIHVSAIQTDPRGLSTSQFYQFGFALGAVALLIPMLVLIGTATRMAAARREERYAAMRLVGAERGQIGVLASVDAVVGAAVGAVAGIGIYAGLRPLLSRIPLLGYRFFDATITPTGWGYLALLAVPAAAAVACLTSLRRVQISPLGVVRRVTPPPPRFWRAIPLLVGLAIFVVPVLAAPAEARGTPTLAVVALGLVMIGLMIAGPWLTMVSASALARLVRGGSGLLASRRLADNPRAAFRAVGGLVLAVMVGTALSALVPAALAAQDTTGTVALSDVLRVGFAQGDRSNPDQVIQGLAPDRAAPLLAAVAAVPGALVVPLYHPTAADDALPAVGEFREAQLVVPCVDASALTVLGTCPPGAQAVLIDAAAMYTDNLRALDRALPFITPHNPATTVDPDRQLLSDLMVKVDSPATLERVRTALSPYRDSIDAGQSPMTFGEVATVRATLYLEIQRVVTILAAVTLLIAGCGLAVAVSGSLVERKRPFTLMRVTGTGVGTLYRAVLLETMLPLFTATVVAAGVGLALAYPIARTLAPDRHTLVLPQPSFYLTLVVGLVASVAVIAATLPVLGRITATENARFE